MCSKARPCAARQRLKYLKTAEIVYVFKNWLNSGITLILFLCLWKCLITKCPVISRPRLLIVRVFFWEQPFLTVCLWVLKALLYHLRLHVYQHWICYELPLIEIPLKVSLNDLFLYELRWRLNLLYQLFIERVPNLIATLSHLYSDDRHCANYN